MRLTNTLRNEIVENLIHHSFNDKIKELEKVKSTLADEFYNEFYSKLEREIFIKHPTLFSKSDRLYCYISGYLHKFEFSKGEYRLVGENWKFRINVSAESNMGEYIKSESELHQKITQVRREAHVILQSVTTVNALIKKWPEVKPFIPSDQITSQNTALVVPINHINELLGI